MDKDVIVDGLTIDLTDETVVEEVIEEQPKASDKSVELRQKQAGYYSRHPEDLVKLMEDVEKLKPQAKKQTSTNSNDEVLTEIKQLRIDNALKDAVIEHNLSKDDIQWIKGSTPQEIEENAKNFVEYKKGLGNIKESNENDELESPSDNSKYIRKNLAPVGSQKSQTFDELERELRTMKLKI